MARDLAYAGDELEIFRHAGRWKAYFGQQIRPFVRGRVLEVGAGLGGTTTALFPGHVGRWVCLEPDRSLADRLRRGIRTTFGRVGGLPEVISGTLADLPACPGFDTILYIDVLEHIEEDATELGGASGLLNDGGHVVVVCPAHQWLFTPFDERIGHYRRYDAAGLRRLTPPNTRLIRLRYLDSVGMLASLANRLVLRSAEPTLRQIKTWDRVLVPVSRVVDPLFAYRLGKSLLAAWKRMPDSNENP